MLAARTSLTDGLAAAGVLDENFSRLDAVCKPGSGYVFKPELTNNNPAVQNLLYGPRLTGFYRRFFGEDIRHYDFTRLRAIGPGKGTNPHCDLPYMGRGTHNLFTAWTPLGDIPIGDGGLMILEKSHLHERLNKNYGQKDVDKFCVNKRGEGYTEWAAAATFPLAVGFPKIRSSCAPIWAGAGSQQNIAPAIC